MYKGQLIRRSSSVYNKQDAYDIGAAYRTQLAKGAVGIETSEEKRAIPTFGAAMKDFLEWSEEEYAAHPNTHKRYMASSKALLAYFGNMPLDRISSDAVEKYKPMALTPEKGTSREEKSQGVEGNEASETSNGQPRIGST